MIGNPYSALGDLVDLVAAPRAVLAGPNRAGRRIDGQSLRVAESERENLGARTRLANERIVLRDSAVGVDPQQLAHQAVELLRLHPVGGWDPHPAGTAVSTSSVPSLAWTTCRRYPYCRSDPSLSSRDFSSAAMRARATWTCAGERWVAGSTPAGITAYVK